MVLGLLKSSVSLSGIIDRAFNRSRAAVAIARDIFKVLYIFKMMILLSTLSAIKYLI